MQHHLRSPISSHDGLLIVDSQATRTGRPRHLANVDRSRRIANWLFTSVTAMLWCSTAPAVETGALWPQFRGPDGQGRAAGVQAPREWEELAGVGWKTPIPGRGWSSPAVAAGIVWLTTAVETEGSREELEAAIRRVGAPVPAPYIAGQVTLLLVGVDLESGNLVRQVRLFTHEDPGVLNSMNSYASPTPVYGDGKLFCDFGALGTACVDASSGKIDWTRRLIIEHQVGAGSSPVLYGRLLILTRDGCDQQYVTALDRRTGQTIWKTDRPPHDTTTLVFRKAFSTPLVFDDGSRKQMVVPAAQWIVSYAPDSGEELWRVDTGPTFSNTPRPVFHDGVVYVCTSFGGTQMLAIRTDGQGDVTGTHVLWRLRRATPRRSSPLLVGERLYLVSDNGIASCVDIKTGEVVWNARLGGEFSASPAFANGAVYFFGEDGTTTVVRPGDEYTPIRQNRLDGRIMASPAFAHSSILLRTDTHLYRIDGR